jgi:hypothetical protein
MRDTISSLTATKEKLDRLKDEHVFMKHNVCPNFQANDVSNSIENLFGFHATRYILHLLRYFKDTKF